MIGLGGIAAGIGNTLNNPAVKNTIGKIGSVATSLGNNTAFGAAPQPAPGNGLNDVRSMTPPPAQGQPQHQIGDIFRKFANNRMAAKTATNVGQGPGAGMGSPDFAAGIGAVR